MDDDQILRIAEDLGIRGPNLPDALSTSWASRLKLLAFVNRVTEQQTARIAELENECNEWKERYQNITVAVPCKGCGQPIHHTDVFNCIDCRAPYHNACLRRHCAKDRQDLEYKIDSAKGYAVSLESRIATVTAEREAALNDRDEEFRRRWNELVIQNADLHQRLEAAERDAERLNWLTQKMRLVDLRNLLYVANWDLDYRTVRDAIDAAIAAEKEGKE